MDNANVGMPSIVLGEFAEATGLGASDFLREMQSHLTQKSRCRAISLTVWDWRRGMKKSNYLLRMVMLAMFVALGVVISPILRVEGMCPMAHLINITCAVFMGPAYALLCALLIGIIRMLVMGIPPLALTGAVFGATLSGVFYKLSKGKIIAAVLGEVIGTGLIGSIVSYPVMTYLWGKEGLTWFFYVPSFIMGTLIGGSIAFLLLIRLQAAGVLSKIQNALKDIDTTKDDKETVA